MGYDLPKADIDFIFSKNNKSENENLDFKEFSLAIFNRLLFKSYFKNKGTESFLATDVV